MNRPYPSSEQLWQSGDVAHDPATHQELDDAIEQRWGVGDLALRRAEIHRQLGFSNYDRKSPCDPPRVRARTEQG